MPLVGAVFIPSYPLALIEFLCAAALLCFCHFFLASPLIGLTLAVLWAS